MTLSFTCLKREAAGVAFALACALATQAVAARPSRDVIRVPLTLVDAHSETTGITLTFNPAVVTRATATTPVRLPAPLPEGARVGLHPAMDVIALVDQAGPNSAFLTVDANMNRDLTDDQRFEVRAGQAHDAGVLVRVRRTYPGNPPQHAWLPYRFHYHPGSGGDGSYRIVMSAAYRREGTFRVKGADYQLGLRDLTALGQFDRSSLSRGKALSLQRAGEPAESAASLFAYELLSVGDRLYALRDAAPDGSWIEFARVEQPEAAIGRVVPDFRLIDSSGRAFDLLDYRGKYLLLDFWPSYCAPCIREFASIKKTLERHAQQPLSVVGINLDPESSLDQARTLIAEHALPWRQVLQGAGYFLPIYQILGQLPEQRMTYPVYVAIRPDGVVAYATNNFRRMEQFFDAVFASAAAATDVLFVPLAMDPAMPLSAPQPVDFTSRALQAHLADPKVKLPADLPQDARVGRLPNSLLVTVRPTGAAEKLRLRIDEDANGDLSGHPEHEIPVLAHAPAKPDDLPAATAAWTYQDGGRVGARFRFFAQMPAGGASGATPEVFYVGYHQTRTGTFVQAGEEYRVLIFDPTRDLMFTADDAASQGFLTLQKRQGARWVSVTTDVMDLPIGGRRFSLTRVADDGTLAVLERHPRSRPD